VIAGEATNGLEAVAATKRLRPDVILMDINMPEMDGFEATKWIMRESPTPIVVMSATTDVRDVTVSMRALRAGALALLEKPSAAGPARLDGSIFQFVSTVKAMAAVRVVRHRQERSVPAPLVSAAQAMREPRVISVAASTGGPAALGRILSELPASFPVPILVVQHIAQGFVEGFVAWLDAMSALSVKVAEQGELVAPATVYVAGDGRHMGVSDALRIVLDGATPIGGFRPSASYLLESAAAAYGETTLAVILTGMGHDGVEGLRAVRSAGGRILVQDEATSVVFGMPGSVIAAGLADEVLPLSAIGRSLLEICGQTRQSEG
jgi:two-component system chemotaxis response regulator CheB